MTTAFSARAAAGISEHVRERLRQQHAQIAQRARAGVEARQGRMPTEVIVDGRRGAAEASVKAFGNIVYRFDAAPRAAEEAMLVAEGLSPVDRSSDADNRVFAKSFLFLVDGAEATLDAAKPGSEIILVNRRFGYSRRLEKGWSLQAPAGVMEVVAALLQPRWRRSVLVEFGYRPIEGLADDERDEPRGRYPVILFRGRAFL
ncbi:MAG: hypothetical protein J0H82_06245 [Alphaproteobacteria bacterium]|jgi:hypothetical protein|nr:hypothetical protein [Alphaproteobacteria bacterium]